MKIQTARKIRRVSTALFALYLLLLFYVLFFSEDYGRTMEERSYSYNLVLFQEIRRFWDYREQVGMRAMFLNIYGNVICFLPFGAILPVLNRRCRYLIAITLFSFEFSLLVETVQLITRVGTFDVDDLFLNTVGGILGYLLFKFCNYWRKRLYG